MLVAARVMTIKVVLSGRWPTFCDQLGFGVGVSSPGLLRSLLWQPSMLCLGRCVSLGLGGAKDTRADAIL